MNPVPCFAALSRIRRRGYLTLLSCSFLLFGGKALAASLTDALDNATLIWRTSNEAPWFPQTTETYDGVDAAQSAPISDGEHSWIETTVTGPAPLSFWWKVSSELGYDRLQFLID